MCLCADLAVLGSSFLALVVVINVFAQAAPKLFEFFERELGVCALREFHKRVHRVDVAAVDLVNVLNVEVVDLNKIWDILD